mgnify:CR=1 FL=1
MLIDKTTIYKCLKHFSVYTEDDLEIRYFPVEIYYFPAGIYYFPTEIYYIPKHSSLWTKTRLNGERQGNKLRREFRFCGKDDLRNGITPHSFLIKSNLSSQKKQLHLSDNAL